MRLTLIASVKGRSKRIMEGTRLRILQLLQKNGSDTVDGISTAVGLAPATIRRHLDILGRDHLVAYEGVRKKTGRPEHAFYLTEAGQDALPKHYDTLLGMVVEKLADLTVDDTLHKTGQDILELVFSKVSKEVVEQTSVSVAKENLGQRLDRLIQHLQGQDFYPEAEVVGNTNIEVRLHNCPFRSVALQNQAVCALDLSVISSTLGFDATRTQSIINEGMTCCTYVAEIPLHLRKELAPAT